jgi:hypothetical protein
MNVTALPGFLKPQLPFSDKKEKSGTSPFSTRSPEKRFLSRIVMSLMRAVCSQIWESLCEFRLDFW